MRLATKIRVLLLTGLGLLVVSLGIFCDGAIIEPENLVMIDMGRMGRAIRLYAEDHEGHLPNAISDLLARTNHRPPYISERYLDVLTHPGIPVVPDSDPPTSYSYVPCKPDASPDTIILFPNNRGPSSWTYVLRLNGRLDVLAHERFETEIRALGVDYEALPVLAAQDMRWDLVSWHVVGVCLGVAALLALEAWLLFRRRRDLV